MIERYLLVLSMTIGLVGQAVAAEEKGPDWNAETLTGDWAGYRSSLYAKGVELNIVHKSDFLAELAGGIKRGTNWMGYTEAGLKMDLEKLLGWNSTTGYIHYHSELGTQFNEKYTGSYVGVDNIETAANTAQFNNIWIQKNLYDDTVSVLTGLYAIDSEFYVTDTSAVFTQPPYGMSNDMAQSGANGPPIYPMGALALRLKYTTAAKDGYVQYVLADGVPGDPSNPHGTHVQLNKGDGTLSVLELGFTPQADMAPSGQETEPPETFNKTAFGFWHYTTRFDDPVDTDGFGNPLRRIDQGFYVLAERTLMREKSDASQGLAGFVRFGTASRDLHQADWTGSLGLRYHGYAEGRDDDIAGIALTYSHASSKFQQINPGAANNQTQIEATYRAQIKPWFALQPSLHYFINPNMKIAPDGSATLQDAWVFAVRFEFVL